jgi:salicylate hydroxylase
VIPRIGRVVVLGDAAHPMMPFYAPGAAQSIEDAYVLAGCLALRPDEPVAALEQYVRLRQPRTAWMQQLSRREEELYHMANPDEIACRNAGLRQNQRPGLPKFCARPEHGLRRWRRRR